MVVIEMRDAAYETAFELLDEAKLNAKKTKLTLCELENAMYDCYDASMDEQERSLEEGEMSLRGVTESDKEYGHDDEDGLKHYMKRMSRRSRGLRMRRHFA